MRLLRPVSLFMFLYLGTFFYANAQHELNFGLKKPLDSALLPKSSGTFPAAVPVPKIQEPTKLAKIAGNEWVITKGWELAESAVVTKGRQSIFDLDLNTSKWYNATVPGTVLTTLVNQGVYPDPYLGLNNLKIPDSLCRMDWWYRVAFDLPAKSNNEDIWLLFNGINYKAEVWLNGNLLGRINGAFSRGEFNIRKFANASGKNVLAVKILPPPNPGIPHEQSPRSGMGPNGGQLALNGPTFISSEGWDWIPGIRDRNIGIWQDVRIRYTGGVKLVDPQIITDLQLPDTSSALITVKTILSNSSKEDRLVTVTGVIEKISFTKEINVKAGQQLPVVFSEREFPQLKLNKPRLWWPNGYGNPELYNLVLSVKEGGKATSDSQTIRFGIRELSYEMTVDLPDEKEKRVEFNPLTALVNGEPIFDNVNRREVIPGIFVPSVTAAHGKLLQPAIDRAAAPYLVIKVNGKRIFCKGGNWGMDDGMKRVSRERLEPNFKLHKEANYNMVRNWTGESTEAVFYELSDEYGMLVWNDFWLSTETYNLNPLDEQLVLDNAAEVIKRFRNHPSIAIWCPRNEGYAPEGLENGFATLIAKLDGTRHYNGNSREINLRQSGPWSYFADPSVYYGDIAHGFSTEVGTLSVPTATTIRKFIAKEDQWPVSDVWFYHDLHGPHNMKGYLAAVDSLYGKATDLDDFSKKVQLINYNSHRAIFESWNAKLWNDASGVLLWMTHPAWPSMTWQTYSYDYETHGAYFGAKKACEPLHIQLNLLNNQVDGINTTLKEFKHAKFKLEVFDLDGKKLYTKSVIADLAANALTNAFKAELPKIKSAIYLVRLTLSDARGNLLSANDYLKNSGKDFEELNKLAPAVLSGKIVKSLKNKLVFQVTNTSGVIATGIKLNAVNKHSNKIILPAYFSEGYFSLLPGEVKQVELSLDGVEMTAVKIIAEGYNFSSVTLTEAGK